MHSYSRKPHTNLTLDLLACPPSRVARATKEFGIRAGFPCHCSQKILSEVLSKFAVGEGFSEVTNKISRSQHSTLSYHLPNHAT
jgi:hypothetical protein